MKKNKVYAYFIEKNNFKKIVNTFTEIPRKSIFKSFENEKQAWKWLKILNIFLRI